MSNQLILSLKERLKLARALIKRKNVETKIKYTDCGKYWYINNE